LRQNRTGRRRLKLHRRLHPRFVTGGHHNRLDPAAPQLRALGLQRVLARRQSAEAVSPIFCGDGARFRAGGLIARHQHKAFQRLRVKISQLAGKRAAL
jgi:hypothetical protein